MPIALAARTALVAVVALLQAGPQIPAPTGLVNDFAHVLTPETAARIERVAQAVRDKTGGELTVVTLPDIGDRAPSDIALRIGREWKVGNMAKIGERSRNAGVVILLVPKETSSDGKGHCRIETGQGVEGFITDATSGEICREATPAFALRDYSTGLERATMRVAQRYAQEFNVNLDSAITEPVIRAPARRQTRARGGGINPFLLILILFVVLSMFGGRGRRRGCLPLFIPMGGGGWGGGGGGFGGGGGGGFGGFGGGGGFSGGGGGSDW